jgi:hypothetical protein
MDRNEFARLPDSIQIRELAFRISKPGFRVREILLATTLLDPICYPGEDLAALYRRRWQAEINLRHLKTSMGLEVLNCKSVEGVLKELWVFALVYNLVRMIMLEAARRQGVAVERISFINALRWLATVVYHGQLRTLAVNPQRPNRLEPRVVNRRPKPYKLMTKPRQQLRQPLLAERDAA